MSLIELIGIQQKFEQSHILQNINLTIERGEVFALIGPTGAGKTTLIRLINLLDLPMDGCIHFDGLDVTAYSEHRLQTRRRMAYVQQRPTVFSMNVYDNVAIGLKWRRTPRNTIRERVEHALKLVGLSEYQKRDARTLSGGETQRVAIARALVTDPELLLLDEPTANLDPLTTSSIEKLISDIIRQLNTTVIMTTHDMLQGQRLATRIGVLMNGSMVQTGDPREIFKMPEGRDVAEFVGMENILDGEIVANDEGVVAIRMDGHMIQAISNLEPGSLVHVCIRPEEITLTPLADKTSARNTFNGEITQITTNRPLAWIRIDCGFPLTVLITIKSMQEMNLNVGTKIYASFKATGVHVIPQ